MDDEPTPGTIAREVVFFALLFLAVGALIVTVGMLSSERIRQRITGPRIPAVQPR